MEEFKRLPDSEFEIMKVIWNHVPPVTTGQIMEELGEERGWKAPTVISFLNRLIKKGFVRSEKEGKERLYYPLIRREEYLAFETENFVKAYHNDSLVSLVNTFCQGEKISREEAEELIRILSEE